MTVKELKKILDGMSDDSEVAVSLDIMDEFIDDVTFEIQNWGSNKRIVLIGQDTDISSEFLKNVLMRNCYNDNMECQLIEKFMDYKGWKDERDVEEFTTV
jgi:hypothetical protein